MKTLYESILDDEDDVIALNAKTAEDTYMMNLVKSCFDISMFHPGEKSQYLTMKSNGHFEYKKFVWTEMCYNLINILKQPGSIIFDYIQMLEFNGNYKVYKSTWDQRKNINVVFKKVDNIIILNNGGMPRWIPDLKIESCKNMKIFCKLDEKAYILPNALIKNLKIYMEPSGIHNTLWLVPGLELLIDMYKNIDAENVLFCADQMIISGIMPFDDDRYEDKKYNMLKIDPGRQKEFTGFFSNNPKVKHLYVFMSQNRRKPLYYEVLPMKTKDKFKLKKITLNDEDFE